MPIPWILPMHWGTSSGIASGYPYVSVPQDRTTDSTATASGQQPRDASVSPIDQPPPDRWRASPGEPNMAASRKGSGAS